MANIEYQGLTIASSSKNGKTTDPADMTLYRVEMPPGTTLSPKMLSTPKVEKINKTSPWADMGEFLRVKRYWYLPSYPQGNGCSVAVNVETVNGKVFVTAPLHDFTGTREMPREAVLKHGKAINHLATPKPKAKRKPKPKASAPAPTVAAPAPAPSDTAGE